MVFFGIGFLITFIKHNTWSALAFNWILGAWAVQWKIVTIGVWHQIVNGVAFKDLKKTQVTLESLVVGDFAAAVALISFCGYLGKVNLQQLFFLVWWEVLLQGLNEALLTDYYQTSDMGGSMIVHAFGAYYGCAATYFL